MSLRILNERQVIDNLIMEFGRCELIVDVGTMAGIPAVFVWRAGAPRIGPLGERAVGSDEDREGDRTILHPGEVVMTFPSKAQATAVRDALLGTAFFEGSHEAG